MNELDEQEIVAIWGISSLAVVIISMVVAVLLLIWSAPFIAVKIVGSIFFVAVVSLVLAALASDFVD